MNTWQAHTGLVSAVAFTPDGRFLLSADSNGTVRTWAASGGTSVAECRAGRPNPNRTPPDWIVACCGDRAIVGESGYRFWTIDFVRGELVGAAIHENLRGLVAADDGGCVTLTEAGNHYWIQSFDPTDRRRAVRATLALSESAAYGPFAIDTARSRYAFGGVVGRLVVGTPEYEIAGVGTEAAGIAEQVFLPSGDLIRVTAPFLWQSSGSTGDHYLRRWTPLPWRVAAASTDRVSQFTGLAATPDGRHVWTVGRDASATCWDAETLTALRTYRLPSGYDCLAVSPDGLMAAAGSRKGTVTVWDLE